MPLTADDKIDLESACVTIVREQNDLLVNTADFELSKDPISDLTDPLPNRLATQYPDADDLREAKVHIDQALMFKGFLGQYLTVNYCPIKEFQNLGHANVAVASKFIRDKFNAIGLHTTRPTPAELPSLSSNDATLAAHVSLIDALKNSPILVQGAKAYVKSDPPPVVQLPDPLKPNTDIYPLKYDEALPPLGLVPLDNAGYAKAKELSKTISSKLSIHTILDRFAKWASSSGLRYTDDAYKTLLGTVLPDAHIKHYESLASDPQVPFHQLAHVLSTKLSGKKQFHVARDQGQDLANNVSDPPLKVLDEIEALFNSVTGKSRERLNEESYLLAEAYLKKRFGPTFWALFNARLQADQISTITDLIIVFKNDYVKLASSYDDEKSVQKRHANRLHNIEENVTAQGSISADVKEIKSYLSHLDQSPIMPRAADPRNNMQPYPSVADSGNMIPSTATQSSYYMNHVAPAPNPAPAQAQPPVFVPVPVPGGNSNTQNGYQNQGFRRSNSGFNRQNGGFKQNKAPRSAGNRFNIPIEKQYTFQSCNIAGHFQHKNRDCHIQTAQPCNYNYRHGGHMASDCIRTKDWLFGAIQGENPVQGNAIASGGNQANGPRARLQAPPQAPPAPNVTPQQLNNLMEKIESHLATCSDASSPESSA